MLYQRFEQDKEYLLNKFRKPAFDPATGLDNECLKKKILEMQDEFDRYPRPIGKAMAFKLVADNIRIDVNPHDWFVGVACWNRNDRPLAPLCSHWNREVDKKCLKHYQLLQDGNASGITNTWKDFDHSVPDWDAVFALGLPGLRERARKFRAMHEKNGTLTGDANNYFEGIDITYGAMLDMLERFRAYALEHANGNARVPKVAECLDHLARGTPGNIYEVLQLIYLYFIFSEHIDGMQVRSLGNLDRTLYPYYLADIRNGTFTDAQIREFLDYFLMQYASINNYWGHPFYIGGTNADGSSVVNYFSRLIIEEFDKLSIVTPKIQVKVAENTPAEFINKVLDMIRRGNSSFVFVSEESVKRCMMSTGKSEEDARTCNITGCYEQAVMGKENQTGAGHINMLKPFELIFHNGVDPESGIGIGVKTGPLENLVTFSDFYAEYLAQLANIIEIIIKTTMDFEPYLHLINPSNVYSATITHSLETARDAFSNGCVYNNTHILNAGFATSIDALMAVKDLVYDRRELTLAEFKEILGKNWAGHEKLRRKILRSRLKFGNGIKKVDFYAEMIARFIGNKINMRPNGRGGYYLASSHSAKQYCALGEKTGATPDGRLAGDEMSKNVSPTMGMDTNGVTALVQSVTAIDSVVFPGDFPLDVMMHPATVQGQEGLDAMRGLINTYMEKHGVAIHFNIFDAQTLREAQAHPENYAGLQVRVCGWNVRFNDMAKKEQDAFIVRAENIVE